MPDRIVAFAGSLRRGAYNRALIYAARELAPEGMTVEPIEIDEIPFYNADVEAEGEPPLQLSHVHYGTVNTCTTDNYRYPLRRRF